jgi:hypothetical protein
MAKAKVKTGAAGAGASLEPLIVRVRGQRVILDADLARLYGVTTGALNQAVKRNAERFPADFAFQLRPVDVENLKSQIVISSSQVNDCINKSDNWSQVVTSYHGGSRHLPWAFTEHGALMAANVLRSAHAVQMSVFVIRAFVRLREQVAASPKGTSFGANTAIIKRLAEIDNTLLQHDTALRDIYQKLLPLLQPAPEPRKRRIGFITDDD